MSVSQVSMLGYQGRPVVGEAALPGDKSISHRALIFAALAAGPSRLTGLSPGYDVASTARCLRALGVRVRSSGRMSDQTVVQGLLSGHTLSSPALREPSRILDCGNSGTTMRLLLGLLAGQPVSGILNGDSSLRRRPMGRVTAPLSRMGAAFIGRKGGELAPLAVRGARLQAMAHDTPVASAQVKSALLLAGLFAEGTTSVREPAPSRDHTERMLAAMGAALSRPSELETTIDGPAALAPLDLRIPGDPSSAAFLAAAALLVPGSSLALRAVSLNPGRIGMFALLKRAGADIAWEQTGLAGGEPVGDIAVRHSTWGPLTVGGRDVPSMIDELPLVALLATRAAGRTEISGAGELRTKESDRLAETAAGLRALSAKVDERPDGLSIEGPVDLIAPSAPLSSKGDHRLAMTWALGGLVCRGDLTVVGMGAAAVSYPGFLQDLERLTEVRR